jgi:hypothetical protein
MGWRNPSTREVSQISPTAMEPITTTAKADKAAHNVFFCQGVG